MGNCWPGWGVGPRAWALITLYKIFPIWKNADSDDVCTLSRTCQRRYKGSSNAIDQAFFRGCARLRAEQQMLLHPYDVMERIRSAADGAGKALGFCIFPARSIFPEVLTLCARGLRESGGEPCADAPGGVPAQDNSACFYVYRLTMGKYPDLSCRRCICSGVRSESNPESQ